MRITEPGEERGEEAIKGLFFGLSSQGIPEKRISEIMPDDEPEWRIGEGLYESLFENELDYERTKRGISKRLLEKLHKLMDEYGVDEKSLPHLISYHFGELLLTQIDAGYIEKRAGERLLFIRSEFGRHHKNIFHSLDDLKGDERLEASAWHAVQEWARDKGIEMTDLELGHSALAVYTCSIQAKKEKGEPILHLEMEIERE